MKTIFITGISSGIGKATAVAFLKRGDCVIGTVRDENSVIDLINQYPNQLRLLHLDLKDISSISEVPQSLKDLSIQKIDILVNNAGIAIAAPFQFQDFSEVTETITINVLAVMKLTQVLIPWLMKSDGGRIINISSVSGQNGAPFLASYCASKHAIEGFSESLRRELSIYGIKVILIGPGSIKTPIWDKGFEKIKSLYVNTIYKNSFDRFIAFAMNEKENALSPEDVVSDVLDASFSLRPKIRYAPEPRKLLNWILSSLLPTRCFDYISCRTFGLIKQK
jgi:short-subunit dehydrogenase